MPEDPSGGPLDRLPAREIASIRRPPAVFQDFDAFLGEALRTVLGRAPSPIRLLALGQAVGRAAVGRAVTGRLEAASPAGRLGVKAGAAALVVLWGWLGPLPIGAAAVVAGVGYLATMRQVTPLRRRYVAAVVQVRGRWEASRNAWIEGRSSRVAHEVEVERLLVELGEGLGSESV